MIYEYWYAGISGLNCMKKKKLREILKTAEMIYYIEEIKLTELGILTDREIQALIKAKKQQDIKDEQVDDDHTQVVRRHIDDAGGKDAVERQLGHGQRGVDLVFQFVYMP